MTQVERIRDYMEQFGSITTLEAFRDLGVTRLASRICDLKKSGFDINRTFETRKNRYGEPVSYARYSIREA